MAIIANVLRVLGRLVQGTFAPHCPLYAYSAARVVWPVSHVAVFNKLCCPDICRIMAIISKWTGNAYLFDFRDVSGGGSVA